MRVPRLLTLALLAVGCAGTSSSPAPVATDGGSPTDVTADTGSPLRADVPPTDQGHAATDAGTPTDVPQDLLTDPPCTPVSGTAPAGMACVTHIQGLVRDMAEHPLGSVPITFCGPACFYGMTTADGRFDIAPGIAIDPSIYTLQVHGRPDHGSVYIPAPSPVNGTVDFGTAVHIPTYATVGPALPGTAGGSVTAGDLTLTVAAGTMLDYSPEDLELMDLGTRLRIAPVPVDHGPPLSVTAGALALWALAPFDVAASLPMTVSLANHTTLPAGAAVDILGLGNSVYTPPLNGGQWPVVATAHVSMDGTRIVSDPGQGITTLTWLGVRAHTARTP